jgi:hypothetical protein
MLLVSRRAHSAWALSRSSDAFEHQATSLLGNRHQQLQQHQASCASQPQVAPRGARQPAQHGDVGARRARPRPGQVAHGDVDHRSMTRDVLQIEVRAGQGPRAELAGPGGGSSSPASTSQRI